MDGKWHKTYSITAFLLVSMATLAAAESQTPNCTNTTQIDLCFLIDRSGSICDADPKFNFSNPNDRTCDNWAFIVNFVYRFVTDLYIGPNDVRVAVVIFDDYAYLKWNLTGYLNKNSLLYAINTTLEYDKGKHTNTADGLNMMADQVFNAMDRPKALKTTIIITDGKPTNATLAYSAVDRVHSLNITTFVVGVTNQIDAATLKQLSSPPQRENETYFIAQTYSTIDTVRYQVLAQTCLQPTTTTSTTTTTTTTTTPTTTTTTTTTTTPTTTTTSTTPTTSTTKTTTTSKTTLSNLPTTAIITSSTKTSSSNTASPTLSYPFSITTTLPITPTSFNPNISAPSASSAKTTGYSNSNTTLSYRFSSTTLPTASTTTIFNPNASRTSNTNPMGNLSATTIFPPTSIHSSTSRSMNSLLSNMNSTNTASGQPIVTGSNKDNTGSSSMPAGWELANGTRSTSPGPPRPQTMETTVTPGPSLSECSRNCAAGCNMTGASKCDRCDLGYGLTYSGSCDKCSPNCEAGCNVTGAYKCDRCDLGSVHTAKGSCDNGISFASVGPLRGPIAGGTTVTISGTWPSEDVSVTGVFIGNEIRGMIIEVSRLWGVDAVVFITPPTDQVGNLLLKVQFSGYYPDPKIYTTFNVSTEKYFMYSDNPRIWEVFPRAHLVSGGTMLTAVGSNLTSIGYAAIQAMVEVCRYSAYGQPLTCSRSSRTRPCDSFDVVNRAYPTELVCKMPQIDLPLDFLDILDNMTVPSNLTLNFTQRYKRDADSSTILSRHKRSAPPGSVQSLTGSNGYDTANIYLRFILDGFQGNELHKILQDTRFYFFTAPEITSSHEVVYFNPEEETTLPIKGKHMLRGCTKEDYKIRLGKSNCSIGQLTDNQLTCTPPETAPNNTNEFDYYFCDLRFTIIVSIGDKIFYYRCLEYSGPDTPPPGCPADCWNNSNCNWKWKQIVLIVGLVIGLVLLLIVIILIICLIVACTRNRKRRREEATRNNHMRSMGVMHGSLGGNTAALNGGRPRGSTMSVDYLTAAADDKEEYADGISVDSSMDNKD